MRLFMGFSLPDHVLAAASSCAASAAGQIPGRYGSPEFYHITLAFLGDVPPERVSDAAQVLTQALAHVDAPFLSLRPLSFFGRMQNAILILPIKSQPSLSPLHDRLIGALARAGLPFDPGPFSPHITLARHAAIPAGLLDSFPVPSLSFYPTHAHLYLSARNDAGILAYTPLHTIPFRPFSHILQQNQKF